MSLPRFFHVGPLTLGLFGLTIAIGSIAGIFYVLREAKRRGMDEGKIADLALYVVVAGIVGARLLYVLLDIKSYMAQPGEILMLQHGGLSFHGGVVGGVAVGYWFARKNGLDFARLADMFAPGLALGYAIARLGCDIYGSPTTAWIGVSVYGVNRHPVQFYSAFASALIFVILLYRRDKTRFHGQLFWEYIAYYSATRFVIEFFRESVMVGSFLSLTQVVSAAALLVAAAAIHFHKPSRIGAGA